MTTGPQLPAHQGRITVLSTLSPVRPDRLAALHRRLSLVQWVPGLGRPLLELGTIHYARWTVLASLPDPDGSGGPYWLNWSYLLFETTYDGDEREYLDTFSDVLPLRISKLFGTCVGFESRVEHAPAAADRVFSPAAFRDFVHQNALCVGHFSAANPWQTVAMIRQALAIEELERRSNGDGSAGLRAAQATIEGLALGPPAKGLSLRSDVVAPWRRKVTRRLGVGPLTLLAPLEPDGWERVSALSEPLEGLPRTHFARLTKVPREMHEHLGHRHPDRLPSDYLLFTADYDGDEIGYLEALRCDAPQLDTIFGHCTGYPGAGERAPFDRWCARHRVATKYYVSGYPPVPVAQLSAAVGARSSVARWRLTTPPTAAG